MAKKKSMRAGVPGRASKRFPTAATARRALLDAIARAASRSGDANFTVGYRCAKNGVITPEEDERLYQQEVRQWNVFGEAELAVLKAMRVYARAIKEEAK
jgi:hypothetical protein